MPFTLIAPPGLSDLPDAALDAEEIAQGQHAIKILENTKFGVVRPEFFYMGRFSDGQTVARPVSKVDNLPYLASEVIYLWEIVLSADPRDGITSGAGTILYFDYQVDQRDKPDPGLVHCKTVYHVQGGQTTETRDGELSVWAIGIRGLDQLDLAAIPAWTNVPDADFDLDSAWREDRLKDLNAAAKRSVVQAEFFDLGEFGNGQTVPRPTSDVDGFLYPYADLIFLTSWRWTPAFATGLSSGPSGATLARLEKSVNGATGLVDTTVTYRTGASSDTVTQDGRVRVFAFGFRAGITATGTVSFTDLSASVFLPGKPPLDDDALVMVRNSKFAALRPEFFVTTQAHGTTVPLPTSPIDSYAYARAELIYLYARSDTAAPGGIGSLLTLHGFIRQDTGAVTLNTLYFLQGGATTSTNNGTFRVVTVALRGKQVEVDSNPTDPGGGEPGFEGEVDNDLVSGGGILLMSNPDFESGDKNWTKGAGFTIENDPANAYDGDWVAKFVGTVTAALRNSVTIPCNPGNMVLGHCFIKRTAGDGSPAVRISWLDVNKSEIATTKGATITSSTYALSRVRAEAPGGTFFARIEVEVTAITVSTTAYFDQFHAAFWPIDANDIDESTTKKWAAESGANITETRTAAAIAGQGALATKSAVDLATAEVLNKTLGNIADTAAWKKIAAAYADASGRPTRLRRAAADLLAVDIIKIAEESRLNALSLQNAPAEAGAEVTTGKSLTLLINRTLANIADTASRFAAVEAGADATAAHTAADTAAVAGTGSTAVRDNAADGKAGFDGTTEYRKSAAPTNNAVPTGFSSVLRTNSSVDITLSWSAYVQGANKASRFYIYIRSDGSAPTAADLYGAVGIDATAIILRGFNPSTTYSFGIAAVRTIEAGHARTAILSPTAAPDWRGRSFGTPNYTGNIATVGATTVKDGAAKADLGLTAAGDLNRDILVARKTSSAILSRASGGTYLGNLAATLGATWGVDLGSRPAELTDGRVAAGLAAATGIVNTNKVVEASLLAGAVALAKQKADSLARMFTTDAKRTNIEAKEPAEVGADPTADHWLDAAVATATAFVLLQGGSSASNGWRRVAQVDVEIGVDVTSIDFNIFGLLASAGPPDQVRLITGAPNVGVIVATAPGLTDTPTNTREGNGVITYSSPPTGVRKAALYINCSTDTPDSIDVGANFQWKVASVDKL